MRLSYRQHGGWPDLDDAITPSARKQAMRYMLKDPNLGVALARGEFKILTCDKVGKSLYRVTLSAKKSVIEEILGAWSEGQWYTLNGKRQRT